MFLCGIFDESREEEIKIKTKTWVENAANIFQKRLIDGLNRFYEMKIISAPFIASWPKGYRDIFYKENSDENSNRETVYVSFNNIWGYRNISRSHSLKKAVKKTLPLMTEASIIFVYSPHTPLLEAAVYAKRRNSNAKICLIVPDLPQYMNLKKEHRKVYDFFKKYDILRFTSLSKHVDSFVVLTEQMTEKLHVGFRPFIVVEGIAELPTKKIEKDHKRGKRVAYAGKLLESFGVKNLLDAFMTLSDQETQLDICGGGDLSDYVRLCAEKDRRIHYHGVVSAEESRRLLEEADVLVNPRTNNEEYTKYSFPSKNIEYLLSGNTVVAYMLDGIPEIYKNFMVIPQTDAVSSLADAINMALCEPKEKQIERRDAAMEYLLHNRTPEMIGSEIETLNATLF